MNARVLLIALLAGFLAGCATESENPKQAEQQTPYRRPLTSLGAKFGALPPAVQSTVLAEAGSTEITDAVRDNSSGHVVYKIYFRDPNLFPTLYVAPDGSVLNPDLTVAVNALPGSQIKASEIPRPVMKVIEDHGPATGYRSITSEKWGDRVIYVVDFKDVAHNPRMFIASDGTVVQETSQ